MKKVLFMIPTLKGGGAEKILIDLLQQFDLNEWSVNLLVLFKNNVYQDQIPSGVTLRQSHISQFRGNIHAMKLTTPQQLYRLLVKTDYDTVISFLEGPTTRIVAGCLNPNTRLINWVHNEFHELSKLGSSYRSIEELQQTYQRFDQTVFVSQTARQALLSLIDLPEEKTKVLYNPLDMKQVLKHVAVDKKIPLTTEQPIKLITIGRLSYQKGYDRLLPIMAKLIHEDGLRVTLDILGVGENLNKLKKQVLNLDLAATVNFLGFVKQPYTHLAQADMFVCSSRYEGYSTVVTEATLLGLPVVTTDCSGMSEILQDTGVITANQEEALYRGLKKVLSDRKLLAELRIKAQQRGQQLSNQDNAIEIINFLREVSS
ncbi:hypothetical protein FC84_GL000755 [Lapidilactobacillus dextrinicus DSM 20335]|uniref:Glycosyltransferase n=1 Tax=Lapidilactobacillus dextrinicus DSM 20335 TaxID=1423738 RepID=A0A0R2BIZ9_9LACO|nr:glycosyltransferase [Lapidilactobacillus dextrinicus]KRM78498.1 hypothetical protein FC84_GL000755 [Lapidilactobacillus dextrinicus DSM 20335]QFG46174.1 glycosyltransferase [Lapidilactobacillus dextrinicus]